MQTVIEVNY